MDFLKPFLSRVFLFCFCFIVLIDGDRLGNSQKVEWSAVPPFFRAPALENISPFELLL